MILLENKLVIIFRNTKLIFETSLGQICPALIVQWSKISDFRVAQLKTNLCNSWMAKNRLLSKSNIWMDYVEIVTWMNVLNNCTSVCYL